MDRSRRHFRVLTIVVRPEDECLYVTIDLIKQNVNSLAFHIFACPKYPSYNIRFHVLAIENGDHV